MDNHINESQHDHSSLEWIFSTKENGGSDFIPNYCDLSSLNNDGLILKAVGKEQLKEIANSEEIDELERFHTATIEREFRIKELRDEIDRLKKQII